MIIEVSQKEESKQWLQVLAVLSCSVLALGTGFHVGWLSPSIPKMKANDLGFEITEEEISYVVVIGPLGYIIGSPLSGLLLDKIGRKNTLLVLSIPQILPWILIATSRCVAMLYMARLITGIADGGLLTTLPVYMCEILEPQVRGAIGSSFIIGMLLGNVMINSYGSYLSIRMTAYASLPFPLLFLMTFVWMPDSPYYLVMKGLNEEARNSLKVLRRKHNVDVELSSITMAVQRQVSEPGGIRDLFTNKANLKAFFVVTGLRTFQQLSGTAVLNFYTQIIFEQAGGELSPAESSIICSAAKAISMCFSSRFLDKFGRKPLLLFSSSGCAILLINIGLFFYFQRYGYDLSSFMWLPVTGMVLYNIICATGWLLVPSLMVGEIFSVSIKSKALSLTHMYQGLCLAIVSQLFYLLNDTFGMHMPFFIFGACCMASCLFCYFVVPETKGKTLEEIQQYLKGNRDVKPTRAKDNYINSVVTISKL